MELENEAKFDISENQIQYTTQTNGNSMRIHGLCMSKENAAALAYLINKKVILEVEIKEKGT